MALDVQDHAMIQEGLQRIAEALAEGLDRVARAIEHVAMGTEPMTVIEDDNPPRRQ